MPRYEPRHYRRTMRAEGLVGFSVAMGESDLWIWAEREVRAEAAGVLGRLRAEITAQIERQPEFLTSLTPLPCADVAPPIVRAMCRAAEVAGVGPMAAVAGAIAQGVAEALEPLSAEVIVENGGDLYLITRRERLVAIVAGSSPLSGKLALRIPAGERVAVCTSSGTYGHSLSFGRADAAVAAASDGALADAVATGLGNRVQSPADVEEAVKWARALPGIRQVVAICGDQMAITGQFEVVAVRPAER
ncbi:MAG: UPF0280 family protein [Armatimonadetes bacterium]|nr:UPF0280 family protein [Armatimonadota bacterium]